MRPRSCSARPFRRSGTFVAGEDVSYSVAVGQFKLADIVVPTKKKDVRASLSSYASEMEPTIRSQQSNEGTRLEFVSQENEGEFLGRLSNISTHNVVTPDVPPATMYSLAFFDAGSFYSLSTIGLTRAEFDTFANSFRFNTP